MAMMRIHVHQLQFIHQKLIQENAILYMALNIETLKYWQMGFIVVTRKVIFQLKR